jgi:ESS family glutamate:Na+ symporter
MEDAANVYVIDGLRILILAIAVLGLGTYLTEKIRFLKQFSIPPSVTGGILCSIAVAIFTMTTGDAVEFDMRMRDILLLIFFSTIGLSARIPMLMAGGKTLAILTLIAAVFLIIQNSTGVLLAMMLGVDPAYGLFGGSVSLAGGYGTAIAWGDIAKEAGLERAQELGTAFATFGLIAGGLVGGPAAQWLINRHKLSSAETDPKHVEEPDADATAASKTTNSLLGTVLVLALCVQLGDGVNQFLLTKDFKVPGFLTAMLVGIFIVNLSDRTRIKLNEDHMADWQEVSLQLFLGMSLMSMDLSSILASANAIFLVLIIQISVITCFAFFMVFRIMGKDYDAAVMCGGFIGLGLGATPVAIANMNSITSKFGPSARAFLVIPLVGAFFIDVCNALVIQFFVGLPALQSLGGS